VAVGNYDLGICGLDWIEELSARYPASSVLKVADLGYGRAHLYVASSRFGEPVDGARLARCEGPIRFVSEYPNLAEAFALRGRLRRFKVFPVWGAAEVYPPESADLVLLRERDEAGLKAKGLTPVEKVLVASAFLIANAESWETRDLSPVLACFRSGAAAEPEAPEASGQGNGREKPRWRDDTVWLALPDGHQQAPAVDLLRRAGVRLDGYYDGSPERRPSCDWIDAKVIRPQDMPLQVANGNFDLAVTGRDWLNDHLYRFPSSPVRKLAELGFGKVRIVAAVSQDLPIKSIGDLRRQVSRGELNPLRVCSEYVNVTDKYLWDNHLSPYRLIPTWGASESFLPDDADLLIENTQTGRTLARQRLEIIDVLFESTACLVGSTNPSGPPLKRQRVDALAETLRKAAE